MKPQLLTRGRRVIREIGDSIFNDSNVVAKLGSKANRCFHARTCYESDDEPLDAMLFEQ